MGPEEPEDQSQKKRIETCGCQCGIAGVLSTADLERGDMLRGNQETGGGGKGSSQKMVILAVEIHLTKSWSAKN